MIYHVQEDYGAANVKTSANVKTIPLATPSTDTVIVPEAGSERTAKRGAPRVPTDRTAWRRVAVKMAIAITYLESANVIRDTLDLYVMMFVPSVRTATIANPNVPAKTEVPAIQPLATAFVKLAGRVKCARIDAPSAFGAQIVPRNATATMGLPVITSTVHANVNQGSLAIGV